MEFNKFFTLIDPFKRGLLNTLKSSKDYSQNLVISFKSNFGLQEHYKTFILDYLNEIKDTEYIIIDMSPFLTIRRVANLDYLRSYFKEFKNLLIIIRDSIAHDIEYLGDIEGPLLVISQSGFEIYGDKKMKIYEPFYNWLNENKLNTPESIHSFYIKEKLKNSLNINNNLNNENLVKKLEEYFYVPDNIFDIAYEITYQITKGFLELEEEDIGSILVIDNLSLIIVSTIRYILKKNIKFFDFDKFSQSNNNQDKLRIDISKRPLKLVKLIMFKDDLRKINSFLKNNNFQKADLEIYSIIKKVDSKFSTFSFLNFKSK